VEGIGGQSTAAAATYTPATVRLIEIRLLEGPNLYRLEPTVKIEVAVGRRRSWFGQRQPGAHAVVELGRPVGARAAPGVVRDLAAWIRRFHRLSHADAWLADEPPGRERRNRRRVPVTIHRTGEPGGWIVAFPWREHERALEIAEGAWRCCERGLPPTTHVPRSRTATRALARIRAAGDTPPAWLRDADRRVPIVSISGTNGKTTTTRMIAAILRAAGRRVGTTTSDGVIVDGRLVDAGDWTGPSGAKQILDRSDIDVAVLETARGGILLRGMGYESNEASVLTNVSSDHLDLQGIHTLPELAEVKSVVARITNTTGQVVLNADDPLVADQARRVRAPVTWFSTARRPGRTVARHLARGGRAVLVDGDWIVARAGSDSQPVVAIAEVPSTLFGLASHNVANALAAAAGAMALGAPVSAVADGLRSFQPGPDQTPGRLNLYRLRDRVVIVDFAHNEAGVNVLLDVAHGIAAGAAGRTRPVTLIIGTAGDRPDDTLRGIGRLAGERADRVVIKQTLGYLRGRTPESVVGEFQAGLADAGVDPRQVPVYESEAAALGAVLNGADGRPTPTTGSSATGGEVVAIMCHEDRDGVEALLKELGARPVDPTVDLPELMPRLQGRPYRGT
jgi:cyanophycin synthetase